MLTHLLVSIVILALASSASSQVATTMSGLPLSRHGYTYFAGDASSPISVEMVIDLTCSETRDAWEVLSAVVHGYSDSVEFNIQILPLPYHQFSFLVSKAASTVLFFEGDKQAFKFMNEAILNQPAIYNSETNDKSYNDVLEIVQGWATNSTTITSAKFAEGFDTSSDAGNTIEMFTRFQFKMAAITSNYGTPMYTINGLKVLEGLDTFSQWQDTLDSLVKKPKQLEADPTTIYL